MQEPNVDEGEAPIGLRWGVERRLQFIDFRLYWYSRINRSDLTEQFGISTPQASADLARYQEIAPDNLVYNPSLKCYLATDEYSPKFDISNASRYLAQLHAHASGMISPEESWLPEVPDFLIVPTPERSVNSQCLRSILRGIRDGLAFRIRYQSMSNPEASWRWVSPHALGFDGFRWHVRAWCHKDGAFKDFVFARIYEIGESKPHTIDQSADKDWLDSVTVIIAPHPDLTESQSEAIKLDYGMPEGVRAIAVPRASLYYFLKRLGLNVDPKQKQPQKQHIVLMNRKEVMAALDRKG